MPSLRFAIIMLLLLMWVSSCIALGDLAVRLVRRLKWPKWIDGLAILPIAALWPVLLVLYFVYDASRHLAQHPYDDAPGMMVYSVTSVLAPLIFFLSLPLALTGIMIGRRRTP